MKRAIVIAGLAVLTAPAGYNLVPWERVRNRLFLFSLLCFAIYVPRVGLALDLIPAAPRGSAIVNRLIVEEKMRALGNPGAGHDFQSAKILEWAGLTR